MSFHNRILIECRLDFSCFDSQQNFPPEDASNTIGGTRPAD